MRAVARIALRDLRGGIGGFRIFLACLALGVMAIAAVASVREAIQTGLTREASILLGGDAEARFTYRFASPQERAWLNEHSDAVSEVADFRSMLAARSGDEQARGLTQVKGVDAAYPLFGTVELVPDMPLAQALAGQDGRPGLVAEPALVDRMNLVVGDVVRLGTQDFILMARLEREPDAATAGFALGPRTIVRLDALSESGLLSPGTLFNSAYRMALPKDQQLGALRREARKNFEATGLRWRDTGNGTPGIARFVDRLSAFLVLVGLAGLAVGGVGVSAAVRSYLEGKTETIATLKTLGAEGRTIFGIYLVQIGALAMLGIGIGLVLGAGLPMALEPVLRDQLPIPAVFGVYPQALAEAGFYGAMTALIFSLWPLARARDIRAAGLFRDLTEGRVRWPAKRFLVGIALLAAGLIGMATWLSGVPALTLWTAAGVLSALVLLSLAARGVIWLSRRAGHGSAVRGRPALRLALGAVAGPGGETVAVTLSLGLGLTVLAAIGQIDSNLRTAIEQDLPDIAPAYFFVDIQNDQLPGFLDTSRETEGVGDIETAPMLRGIITRINGQPAREVVEGGHWTLRGDRGVTYAGETPAGTTLTQGNWWPSDYSGPPLMSFAEEEALELGLRLGDKVTVNILGRDLTAEIANFRVVEFRDMGINFLMVLNPAALAGAPHTHIATVHADPDAEASLVRGVSEAYPNVTAIRVRDAIERVTQALKGLSSATRYGAAATLVTGFVVLIGAAAAGERRRTYEAAVLKTLGASRRTILTSFALRSAVLGATAGLIAILSGALAGWAVMTFVMDSTYRFEPLSAILIIGGGALASLVAGLLFAMRPLAARPARVLRARE